MSEPEIVLKAEEIARLTGKTKKGIKKGLKKLVERSASSHGESVLPTGDSKGDRRVVRSL